MQITIREPGSAFTHFFAMMLALIASTPLLVKTASDVSGQEFASMCVFAASMVLLYASSATYHSVNLSDKHLKIFRKIDHMMILALIAAV